MSEFDDVPVDLPPELEEKIQKMMDETGLTRDEIITSQLKALFKEVDHPSPNAPAIALKIRRAKKELGAGG